MREPRRRISPPARRVFLRHGGGSPQRGFSLFEVLVVVLILSFGMLGIAALQANTAKFKINSWGRAAASVLFSDLADRVRANPTQAGPSFASTEASPPASGYLLTSSWTTQQADTLNIATDCLATACTAAARATFDMLSWRTSVRRKFPQGAAVVTGNRSAGITATIAWFDRQFTLTDGSLDTSPVCVAGSTGAAEVNCCPQELGNPLPAGVRCTSLSFLP